MKPISNSNFLKKYQTIAIVFFVLGVLSLFLSNSLISIFSLLILLFIVVILNRPNEPQVLLFGLMFQWIQVSSKIFQANLNDENIMDFTESKGIELAVYLSLIGLIFLSYGIKIGISRLKKINYQKLDFEIGSISVEKVFFIYEILFLISFFVDQVDILSQFAQIIFPLLQLKFVFLFIIFYISFKKGKISIYFYISILQETIFGLNSYFSGWKTAIFFMLIAMMSNKLKKNHLVYYFIAAFFLLAMSSAWMMIRTEHRGFLNQGTNQQVISVGYEERLESMIRLVSSLKMDDYLKGFEQVMNRISYIEMLAYVIEYVPTVKPHQHGKILYDFIPHILKPRVIFPDKEELPSDSEQTMEYTGRVYASKEQGTSVSLGYMAECYIDWGIYFMFIPIFFIGYFFGLIYCYFIKNIKSLLLSYGVVATFLIKIYQFEVNLIKLIPGMISSFIVFYFLFKYATPLICKFLFVKSYDVVVNQKNTI